MDRAIQPWTEFPGNGLETSPCNLDVLDGVGQMRRRRPEVIVDVKRSARRFFTNKTSLTKLTKLVRRTMIRDMSER